MGSVSQNMLPDFISFSENRKLKEEIAELKRQNSQMEIDFEDKLEKSQENIDQMKEEIDFLANINQQFGAENDQLIKNLDRFRKYRIPESVSVRSSPGDSGTEPEIIPSKRPKGRKLKSKKIAKTNKGKRVLGNDSEEVDTESDDEKNEKDARVSNSVNIQNVVLNNFLLFFYFFYFLQNEMKTIIKRLIPNLGGRLKRSPSRDFPLTMANENREFLFIRISPTKKKSEKHERYKKLMSKHVLMH